MKVDFLIIGQGLAGSLLAWELIQRGKKVAVIDNEKENASRVAAGLINPVTGMRFVKSVDVDQLLPYAIAFYHNLSHYFKQSFYIEKTMLRVIRNEKERNFCKKRLQQQAYARYLTGIIPSIQPIKTEYGVLCQNNTGYLLTQPLLSSLKHYFLCKNMFINSEVNYDEIKLSPHLQWRHITAKKIVFCEGYAATANPWFSWLPFQPVKGEIISCTASKNTVQNILNYGHWFIPLDNYRFRTGATFDRDNLNTKTTHTAKTTLLDSLKQIYPTLAIKEITHHQAGIRPTTQDKLPFIGPHPNHSELVIFNGFGAKGSLQIPWYCQRLTDTLLSNHPIPQPANIHRYKLNQ